MIERDKSGQFFIIAIVLIYLSIISIFFYIRSSEETSVNFFIEDYSLDMENIINAVHRRNDWMQGNTIYNHWFLDASFEQRRRVSVTCTSPGPHSNPSLIKFPANVSVDEVRNCSKEIRVVFVKDGNETQSSVNSSSPPCTVYWNVTCGQTLPSTHHFYVYWDNKYTEAPLYAKSGRQILDLDDVSVIGIKTRTEGPVEISPAIQLCNHFENLYPKIGLWINCTSTFIVDPMGSVSPRYNNSGNKSVVQLEARSTNFYFNGTIT